MALILEQGNSGAARWVKRGTQVGHFVIQEIRPGSVMYREGEQVREMAIERQATGTMVTADNSGGSIGSVNATSRAATKTDTAPSPAPTCRTSPSPATRAPTSGCCARPAR